MSTSEVLSNDEVDELLNQEESASETPEVIELDPYEFSQHKRYSIQNLKKLHTINEIFTHSVDTQLAAIACRKITVEAQEPEIIFYDEYINSIENPMILNLINIDSLNGVALIVFTGQMISNMLDIFFGGDVNKSTSKPRHFGQIEIQISKLIVTTIDKALTDAWQIVKNIEFDYFKSVTNPDTISICDKKSRVLVNKYTLSFDNVESEFSLCIPCQTLEPILDLINYDHTASEDKSTLSEWNQSIKTNLKSSTVTVDCIVAKAQLKLKELLSLKAGDIVSISNPEFAKIKVGDVHLYNGKNGIHNNNRAVKIIEKVEDY